RILVVDDDTGQRLRLAEMIGREGWSFYGAESVEEALAAARDVEPEVIVLDPGLERGRGSGLLLSLRQSAEWVPILLLTDDPKIADQWALEHGASGLTRKPGGLAELRARIAELVDRRATDRPL